MLQVKDLKIGNWVKVSKSGGYNNIGDLIEIYSISSKGVNDWSDMGASGSNTFDGIDRIPLSLEILEKCGCAKAKHISEYAWHTKGGLAFAFDGKQVSLMIENKWILFSYLHQFQNIVSLTGEELTINL